MSTFLGPKRLLKIKKFAKQSTFPVKKIYSTNSSQIIELDKRQGKFYKGQQPALIITLQLIKALFGTSEVVENTQLFTRRQSFS